MRKVIFSLQPPNQIQLILSSDTGARVLLIAPHAGGIIVHRRVSSEVTRQLGARRSWAEYVRQLKRKQARNGLLELGSGRFVVFILALFALFCH